MNYIERYECDMIMGIFRIVKPLRKWYKTETVDWLHGSILLRTRDEYIWQDIVKSNLREIHIENVLWYINKDRLVKYDRTIHF